MPNSGAGAIATAVDEDRGEPGAGSGWVGELVVRAERLEQTVLDRVLRLIVDERPGDRVQPAELLGRQHGEAGPGR
jgi:hypothetical protein